MTTKSHLIRSTGIIGSATAVSRVLGFIRDILIARFFGTTIYAQGFVMAFTVPNLLRDLVGEGATNAAFVPVLTEYRETRSSYEYWHLAHRVLYCLVLLLFFISVLGVIFSPLVVRLIAPGFARDPQKLAVTINLTRVLFPYIFLVGLSAYCMGILNSLKHFTVPAMGPAVLNLCMIASLIILARPFGIMGLAVGILIGGLLQVSIQIPVLMKRGFNPLSDIGLFHPEIFRIGRLLLPRIFGSAVYHLNVIVDRVLSSLAWIVGEGGVAALYYSNRLIQLPLAIFGIALAQAALPRMSSQAARKDIKSLKETIAFALKSVFFVTVPASIGLALLGRVIIEALFQRGEFTTYSTGITYNALFFYSFGLVAYAGIKIMVTAFYSMGDTATPVKTAGVALVMNVILNLILMWPLKIGGLALATSISATCNFLMLFVFLTRKIGNIGIKEIAGFFLRICVSALFMGAFLFLLVKNLTQYMGRNLYQSIGILAGMIISCIAVYIFISVGLKVVRLRDIAGWVSGKK